MGGLSLNCAPSNNCDLDNNVEQLANVGQGAQLAKIDIESGYPIVPKRPGDWVHCFGLEMARGPAW